MTAEAVRIWLSCTEMRELIQDLRMANTIVQTFGCCEAVQVVRDPRHGIYTHDRFKMCRRLCGRSSVSLPTVD